MEDVEDMFFHRGRHHPRGQHSKCDGFCLECRVAALEAAVAALEAQTSGGGGATPGNPVKIHLANSQAWEQGTEERIMAQIQDNEQYVVSVAVVDAKGNAVADVLNYSIDNQAVATLTVADDGQSVTVTAVAPGSANLVVTDNTGLSATEVVTVVAGPAVSLTLTDSAAVAQA